MTATPDPLQQEPQPLVDDPAGTDDRDASAAAGAAALLAEAAARFAEQQTAEQMLEQVVLTAVAAVPGCDEAGITMLESGSLRSPASAGLIAAACDDAQNETGEGPCLTALETATPTFVSDTTTESRWPGFIDRIRFLPVRSILAVPLATPRPGAAALNLYAVEPAAFDTTDETLALALTTHAGIALMHSELERNLRDGLATREGIGRAVGILMERHRMTASQAFDLLVYTSQRANRKLRDVAQWIVETGQDPSALVPHNPQG